MVLLLLGVLLLLPLSSFAQSVPSMPQGGNITIIPNPLGYSAWSDKGSHIEVVGTAPGNQMYFSYDRFNRAIGSGFINQPFIDRPLLVPESSSPPTLADLSAYKDAAAADIMRSHYGALPIP